MRNIHLKDEELREVSGAQQYSIMDMEMDLLET